MKWRITGAPPADEVRQACDPNVEPGAAVGKLTLRGPGDRLGIIRIRIPWDLDWVAGQDLVLSKYVESCQSEPDFGGSVRRRGTILGVYRGEEVEATLPWSWMVGPITLEEAWHTAQLDNMDLQGVSLLTLGGKFRVYREAPGEGLRFAFHPAGKGLEAITPVTPKSFDELDKMVLRDEKSVRGWKIAGVWRMEPRLFAAQARMMGFKKVEYLTERLTRRKAARARQNGAAR